MTAEPHYGIVVCDNGEPDPMGYRYFGPFDGPHHARLWEQTVHRAGMVPCRYQQHWIETLERPRLPPARTEAEPDYDELMSLVANDPFTETEEWGAWPSLLERLMSIHGHHGDGSRREAAAMFRHLMDKLARTEAEDR